jgi:hypothetical protein
MFNETLEESFSCAKFMQKCLARPNSSLLAAVFGGRTSSAHRVSCVYAVFMRLFASHCLGEYNFREQANFQWLRGSSENAGRTQSNCHSMAFRSILLTVEACGIAR